MYIFSVIGTAYGAGDGSTTFNLPNIQGRTPVGKDTSQTEFTYLGQTGGEKTHTQTLAELCPHHHASGLNGGGSATGYGIDYSYTQEYRSYDGDDFISIVGGGQPMNNLQPYVVTNYIIKAKQSAGVVATVVDNLTSTSSTDALSAKQGNVLNDSITSIKNKFVYSTTETVIGTYNGKPLYRKTVTATAPEGDVTNFGIPHGISNLKAVIHQELNATNNSGNTYH